MKKIGIILGTERDLTPLPSYYKKHKKAFDTALKDLELTEGIDDLSYDIQIYALAKKFSPKNVEIIPLWKLDYEFKEFNELDLIYCIYEFPLSLEDYGEDGPKKLKRLLKNTKAKTLPSYELSQFVYSKETYLKFFKKHNIPTIDTIYYNINLYKNDKRNITKLVKRLQKVFDGKSFFCKPEGSSYSKGTRLFNKVNEKTLKTYLDMLVKKGFHKILIQPYIEEFLKYHEIKTIWMNGEYQYAYGTKVLGYDDDDIYNDEINKQLLDNLIEKGKEVMKLIQGKFGVPFILRIDWGCCLQNDSLCREYFLNEIEFSPAMNHNDSVKGDFFEKIAKNLHKRL